MGSCYCATLRRATRRISALYDEALAPLGVNIAQFSLLRRVGHAGGLSLTALAQRCELDRSTVGRNVKVLERMGLLGARTGDDGREALIALTARGETVLAEGAPRWDAAQRLIEQRLGGAGAAGRLKDVLDAL